MKKRLSLFVATLATLFVTLTASAQGEWKWAHCWSSTPPPNNYDVNTVKNIDFDDEGNVYVLGTFGGNLTFDGNTFLFLNNPTVYYNSSWSAFIMKYDTMGNMLWHKEVKTSRDSRCIPHWLEVRDNKVYVMGNAGLTDVDAYSDDQAWHYWLDTLITGSQVRPIPRDQRVPPRTVGRWSYLATFDLDGNLLDSHFVQPFGRKIYANNIRAEEYLCNEASLNISPFHVDAQGNTYIFTKLVYDGPSTNPYTLVVDGDTNRKYDIYFPEGSDVPGPYFTNIMMYKFSPDWELLFAKQLIDHSDGIGLSIGDSINPYTPSLSGFSVDEEGNFYLSGHFMIPTEDIYFNIPPQFPVHIYWDSIHYVTIQDYSSDITPFIIKYNADGELLWCNQIYTLGSHDPNLPDHAHSNVSGCYYNNGHVYMIGVGAYGPQGSVYFDDPSHPLSQMVENQLNIGFFVGYDAMTGHYVSHGIVPANNSGTGFRLAALHNRVFAYAIANLINQAFYQWREDGLFIHADTIYSSSSFGYGNTYVNNQGYMAISGECQSSVTFSDNVSVCSSPTVCKSAVIALYHNPEFAQPFVPDDSVGIEDYLDRRERDIYLYPNPTSGPTSVHGYMYGYQSIELYDLQGRKLADLVEAWQPSNASTMQPIPAFDLSPYPAGTYLVKINFERGVSVVRKVVRS